MTNYLQYLLIFTKNIVNNPSPTFTSDDYFFENNKTKEFSLLNSRVQDIFDKVQVSEDLKKVYNEQYTQVVSNINNHELVKNFTRFILLNFHPDKLQRASGRELPANIDVIFADMLSNLSTIKRMTGGSKKIMKGGGLEEDKSAFLGLNKLLGKTIIENSLSLMKCIQGEKSLGYFPILNTEGTNKLKQLMGDPTNYGDFRKFYKLFPGTKPKFINIFNGEGIKDKMIAGGYLNGDTGEVLWTNIFPTDYSLGKATNGAPLEFRKLLARRILLNIQVLILYLRCSPNLVSVSKLLNGLYLTIDKTKRSHEDVKRRGYWGKPKSVKNDLTNINNFTKTSGEEEIKQFIKLNRSKWFGFMFDFYANLPEGQRPKGWSEYNTAPLWLTNGTEDDALQYSFNIVLQHLLPEFVLFMGDHPMFTGSSGRIDFRKMNSAQIGSNYPLQGPTETSNKSYIISNASKFVFPSKKSRMIVDLGYLIYLGNKTRDINYCPITAIADSQPTCSVTTKKMAEGETYPRTHQYDLEMAIEAEDAIGQIYSYVIEMVRVNKSRDTYYISAALSMPGYPSLLIGDKSEINDLKGSPLGAVTTYYSLLTSMRKELKQGRYLASLKSRRAETRDILENFFKTNMEIITKMSVKKSIGDYGQEHELSCRWGSGNPVEVRADGSGYDKVLPYTTKGNSLRFMLANDRPSAYRNMFMLLFAEEDFINSRAVTGYWNENPDISKGKQPVKSLKNTILISLQLLFLLIVVMEYLISIHVPMKN